MMTVVTGVDEQVSNAAVQLDIVVPVYNEDSNVLSMLHSLKRNVHANFRVLICYDMDHDTTLPILASLPPGEFSIRLVKNPQQGPHSAVRAGFAVSKAPMVLVYMADDDYNSNIIDIMIKKIYEGYDVVVASRFMPGGEMKNCSSRVKELVTRIGAFMVYRFGGVGVHDPTNAFRLYSRRVIEMIEIESSQGFTFSIELLVKTLRLGWRVTEVPAQWLERNDKPSRFRVFAWMPYYLPWALYAMATRWLKRGPETVTVREKLTSDGVPLAGPTR
jgi:dolichol-phosphate mannosyltransferase